MENSDSKNNNAATPRRRFLSFLWVGLGLAALAELFWVVTSFLRPDRGVRQGGDPETVMQAGAVDAFACGTVTAFPRGRFYLARLEDGGFLALSRRCPHLGCTLPWIEEEKKFLCPCHSSAFDIHGDVLRSPAPHAMALHPIFIENEVVRVDTAMTIKRDRFREDQVAYAKKT
ncbi:cytochrome b6 [Desulfosarcina widdelii]|uniref:Cytochrome b6 n=1 Tax=Desulfosarcina widdelii TaxID=947919 RepID=A0A5K7ZBA9_9BACT|nr:Rieske 2Fe-2S domain-containing protein [Desulfosarcina widdelii]BBO78080.1 cytochrome b6 [Desulfosarcina widdelii]